MTILDKIIENKKREVALMKQTTSIDTLTKQSVFSRKTFSLKSNLRTSSSGIISEFKRKSPSKGFIHEGAIVEEITAGYEKNGASGISVLADKDFFAGGADDIRTARSVVKQTPILFKEFVIDEYQLYLAKASGADVVLLIASALTIPLCKELTRKAHELGLEILLELYEPEEVSFISPEINMVGINNRNLKTFEVNLEASIRLCHEIPDEFIKVSESGISSPNTVKMLREEGFRGFLMGENFMKESDPAKALKVFIQAITQD